MKHSAFFIKVIGFLSALTLGVTVFASGEITVNNVAVGTTTAEINATATQALLTQARDANSGFVALYGQSANNLDASSSTFYGPNTMGELETIQSDGSFSLTLSGLTAGTTYYLDIRNNLTGVSYLASPYSFTTQSTGGGGGTAGYTVIFESSRLNVTDTGAHLEGTIAGTTPLPSIKLRWLAQGETVATSSPTITLSTNGEFTYNINGLRPNTSYTVTVVNASQVNQVFGQMLITTATTSGGTGTTGGITIGGTGTQNQTGTGTTQGTNCTEGEGEYCLLAPLPVIGSKIDNNLTFETYVNSVIKLLIGLAAVLAVVMIVIAGIQNMGNESASLKTESRNRIQGALAGLLLILGSFAILNTINPNLVDLKIGLETVRVDVDGPPEPVYIPGVGTDRCNGVTLNGQRILDGQAWDTNPVIRTADQQLRSAISGITVNKPNCSVVGGNNCTSMYFSDPTAVASKLNSLKNACAQANGGSCPITITGGSECWLHKSHNHNVYIFDFSAQNATELNKFITGSPTYPNNGIGYPKSGIGIFYAERAGQTSNTTAPHWHVKLE